MSSVLLPEISTLPSANTETLVTVLDTLFEPSVPLHTLTLPLLRAKTFTTYLDLIAAVGVQLTELCESSSTSDTEWLDTILAAHPRLGAKKVESAQSKAEQASLQSSAGETQALLQLNQDYEARFPGLRYVVFVNQRPRAVIMEDMRGRIERNDINAERHAALKAMCDIAADRATKLGTF